MSKDGKKLFLTILKKMERCYCLLSSNKISYFSLICNKMMFKKKIKLFLKLSFSCRFCRRKISLHSTDVKHFSVNLSKIVKEKCLKWKNFILINQNFPKLSKQKNDRIQVVINTSSISIKFWSKKKKSKSRNKIKQQITNTIYKSNL